MKAILFDFGNVLATFRHETACERLTMFTEASAHELYTSLCIGHMASKRQTGEMSGETFFQKVKEKFGLSSECTFTMFQTIWGDIFSPASNEVLSLLEQINPEVVICIASNTEELHWPYIESLEIVQYFDDSRRFRSFDIGYEKPDVHFFQHILNELKIEAKDSLFIDDVADNVKSFTDLGGNGEMFNLKMDNPKKLKKILDDYGLLR